MLWKFPHNAHLINLDKVEVLSPITTVVTPAEGNFAETRKCWFTVTVAGKPVEIAVVDYDSSGMLPIEDWNRLLDELEADHDALVWQLLGAQTPPEQPDTGGLKDEVLLLNATNVTRWHNKQEANGQVQLSLEAVLPDHPQTDELIQKLMEYARQARMPEIHLDEPQLGSAAL